MTSVKEGEMRDELDTVNHFPLIDLPIRLFKSDLGKQPPSSPNLQAGSLRSLKLRAQPTLDTFQALSPVLVSSDPTFLSFHPLQHRKLISISDLSSRLNRRFKLGRLHQIVVPRLDVLQLSIICSSASASPRSFSPPS